MREGRVESGGFSRREFLAAGAATVMASAVPAGSARAQAAAKNYYVRMNLSDPKAAGAIKSYEAAIAAMLKLPPTDPRNWYRNAFVHLLDCPHGNWWFLPWHRGYLGWFEQTCRTLSKDPSFALPYWDWTAEYVATGEQSLSIPPAFANVYSVLNPSNPAYIAGFAEFQQQFTPVVQAYYSGLTPAQQNQLAIRGLSTPNDFWAAVNSPGSSMFFPGAQARQPNFSPSVLAAVSPSTVLDALAPTTFTDFGSGIAPNHSGSSSYGILEGQPHNNVHVAVGGFMSDFLSPVDPIFFMHHGNIDRLWDVWTRKEQALMKPTLPEGGDLSTWQQEPFLFYVNSSGQPVAQGTAGDYATIGQFAYSYQPGFGEQVIPNPAPLLARRFFPAALNANVLDSRGPTTASANVPQDLTHPAAASPPLFARITLQPPANRRNVEFHVLVNPPANVRDVGFANDSFAGTITFFGNHTHGHSGGDETFDVPLTNAVKKLRAAGKLNPGDPLRVQVVAANKAVTLAPFQVPLKSVTIGTF